MWFIISILCTLVNHFNTLHKVCLYINIDAMCKIPTAFVSILFLNLCRSDDIIIVFWFCSNYNIGFLKAYTGIL